MSRRLVAFAFVVAGSACIGDSDRSDPAPTSTPPLTVATGARPPCADRPSVLLDCVLVSPSQLGPEWMDLEDVEMIEQPDVIGVEEVAICGSTVTLTPQEKRSIRVANLDPMSLTRPGAIGELLSSPTLPDAVTLSASVSHYSEASDANRALEGIRVLGLSCDGRWTDANGVSHEISVSNPGPHTVAMSVSANPMTTLLAGEPEEQLCEDPVVANAIDLVIGSMAETAISPDQLRDFICSGSLADFLAILEPFGAISLQIRVSVVDHVLVSTVGAASPTASDPGITDRVHSGMVTRAGGG